MQVIPLQALQVPIWTVLSVLIVPTYTIKLGSSEQYRLFESICFCPIFQSKGPWSRKNQEPSFQVILPLMSFVEEEGKSYFSGRQDVCKYHFAVRALEFVVVTHDNKSLIIRKIECWKTIAFRLWHCIKLSVFIKTNLDYALRRTDDKM